MNLFARWITLTGVVLLAGPASASSFCADAARDYRAVATAKQTIAPFEVAVAYIDRYAAPSLGREAQAVWSRMLDEDATLEEALSSHFSAYHAEKSDTERNRIQNEVVGELSASAPLLSWSRTFESVEIKEDWARERFVALMRE